MNQCRNRTSHFGSSRGRLAQYSKGPLESSIAERYSSAPILKASTKAKEEAHTQTPQVQVSPVRFFPLYGGEYCDSIHPITKCPNLQRLDYNTLVLTCPVRIINTSSNSSLSSYPTIRLHSRSSAIGSLNFLPLLH